MKVEKRGKVFEITGVEDVAEATRFLRQNGFKILDDSQTRVDEQRNAPVQSEQKCPRCAGSGRVQFKSGRRYPCGLCNGTGISNRSDGG